MKYEAYVWRRIRQEYQLAGDMTINSEDKQFRIQKGNLLKTFKNKYFSYTNKNQL